MTFHEFTVIALALFCGSLSLDVIHAAWQANVPPENIAVWMECEVLSQC